MTGIPLSPTNQVPLNTKSIDIRTDDDNYKAISSTVTPSVHSSFVSGRTNSYEKSFKNSTSSSNQSEITNKKKSVSEYSSHTPIPSSYTSFVTGTETSEPISSRNSPEDGVEDQIDDNRKPDHRIDKVQKTDIKAASPSESSISEVVSVIVNSKNGEKEHTDVSDKNNASSTVSSVKEENMSEADIQEVELADDKSPSSEVVLKSPEGSIQEILEESPPHDDNDQIQNLEHSKESSSPTAISEE